LIVGLLSWAPSVWPHWLSSQQLLSGCPFDWPRSAGEPDHFGSSPAADP
jgi:hypothetical protein